MECLLANLQEMKASQERMKALMDANLETNEGLSRKDGCHVKACQEQMRAQIKAGLEK
jgi:hypothetical protein